MATLTITATHNYTNDVLNNIDKIVFSSASFIRADFSTNQFGAGKISDTVAITGDGNDEIFIASAGVTFSAAGWTFTNWTPGSDFIVIRGNGGAETLTGSSQSDNIFGGGGADTLDAGGGDDFIGFDNVGKPAAGLTIDGGTGFDTIRVFAAETYDFRQASISGVEALTMLFLGDTVMLNGDQVGAGAMTQITGAGSSSTQAIVVGGSAVDLSALSFSGWGGAHQTITIAGTAAADSLTGSSQNDILKGGAAADTMTGLAGNDFYYVDDAADKVIEAAGGGTDRVFSTVSYALQAGQEIETLSTTNAAGTTAIDLTGNAFANTIYGNAGKNVIDGKGDADTAQGYGGDDIYYVDNAGDKVVEAAGGGTDRVLASVNYTLGANQEIERLSTTKSSGTTAIDLTGNGFDNLVYGNAGANVINGKLGNDVLTGLGGKDTFVFSTALGAGNVDTIADFGPTNDDVIQLAHTIFAAAGAAGTTLSASAFHVGAAATDTSQRIVYNNANGALFYDSDGLGGGAQVQFAKLSAGLAVTNADFKIV